MASQGPRDRAGRFAARDLADGRDNQSRSRGQRLRIDSSSRTILCYPQETFFDTGMVPTGVTLNPSGLPQTAQFNANAVAPYSQWVAGAMAAKDLAQGYWWSPSNTQVEGMLGPDVQLYASILDASSDTNNLNAAGIVTVFNAFGTGFGCGETEARRTRPQPRRTISSRCAARWT